MAEAIRPAPKNAISVINLIIYESCAENRAILKFARRNHGGPPMLTPQLIVAGGSRKRSQGMCEQRAGTARGAVFQDQFPAEIADTVSCDA